MTNNILCIIFCAVLTKQKVKNMAQKITNKDYIAINRNGVFVGGKKATRYQGQPIAQLDRVENVFHIADAQGSIEMGSILEIRVMLSNTRGEVFKPGNPVPANNGSYVWLQAITEFGVSPWISRFSEPSYGDAASLCAIQTMNTLAMHPQWRELLLKTSSNGKKAKLAFAKPTKAIDYSSDASILSSIGKITIEHLPGAVADGEPEFMTLEVVRKNKRSSEATRLEHIDLAEDSLKSLGFKDISDFRYGEGASMLVYADIKFEYDINAKPYTITKMDSKEAEALHSLTQDPAVKIQVHRDRIDPKKGYVFEQVRPDEFRQAIANYLKQRQM